MKLLILDRDGVINQDSDDYIKSTAEFIPIPGSIEAIARLCQDGFSIYIASNQSGLGRDLFTRDTLDAMHDKLKGLVAEAGGSLSGIFFCPHLPEENCNCRKPAPGLLQQIAHHAGRSLEGVPLIGDSLKDLQAGMAMGCRPILVKTGKGAGTLDKLRENKDPLLGQLPVFDSLAPAADALMDSAPLTAGEHTRC